MEVEIKRLTTMRAAAPGGTMRAAGGEPGPSLQMRAHGQGKDAPCFSSAASMKVSAMVLREHPVEVEFRRLVTARAAARRAITLRRG